MRETHTIGEWMDRIAEWEGACEHGSATTTCELCAGALHPALQATATHLENLLSQKSPVHLSPATALKLSMETDGLSEAVKVALEHLRTVEETPEGEWDKAIDERKDLKFVTETVRALVDRFRRIVPDLLDHRVTAGVRHLDA